MHDARIHGRQILRPKAQALHDARAEVLVNHVAASDQFQEGVLTLRGLEVQHDAALVALQGPGEAFGIQDGGSLRPVPQRRASTADRVNPDHIGAQATQDL